MPFDASHGKDVVDLIAAVFVEYGMTFDPDDFDADLQDVRAHYLGRGGIFAVLVDAGRVIGTVAALPCSDTTCEIKRLYLRPEYRGQRHGRRLMEHVLAWAAERRFHEAIAWSDVRLLTAHRVYERLGFAPIGERTLADIDRSREYGFRLALQGKGAGRSDASIR